MKAEFGEHRCFQLPINSNSKSAQKSHRFLTFLLDHLTTFTLPSIVFLFLEISPFLPSLRGAWLGA